MQRRHAMPGGSRRYALVPVLCWLAASTAPLKAAEWSRGDLVARLDSFASVGFSLRTESPDCRLI